MRLSHFIEVDSVGIVKGGLYLSFLGSAKLTALFLDCYRIAGTFREVQSLELFVMDHTFMKLNIRKKFSLNSSIQSMIKFVKVKPAKVTSVTLS